MTSATRFEHLFTPISLGPVTLKNRIYVTPHATMFASDDRNNLPGETLAYYCAERARGGAALVEVSLAMVTPGGGNTSTDVDSQFDPLCVGHPMALSGRWPIRGFDPKVVEGYSRLAKAVHAHGGKCFVEIQSVGTNQANFSGVSKFPWPTHPIHTLPFTSRELDKSEIEQEIEAYGVAAKFAKEGGLDGIDLHGSHGTLICEFLSGAMNKRKDEYGGSIENRARFVEQVIKRVREFTKNEIAVAMRLDGDERFVGGNTPEVAAEIAKRLDGSIDMVTVDQGISPQQEDWQATPMYVESGYNLRLSSPVKSALTKTKMGVVGKYLDPVYAESLLSSGLADMVAMTRALIADPELPNKAMDGRLEDIRPCIGVLQDCWGRMIRGLPISCTVNPVVSREKDWGMSVDYKPVEKPKKILVIGAGVAGLELARVASSRGHRVVVYEKSKEPGGQALLAARLPGRENIRAIVNWLLVQIKKLHVEVKYGLEVTSEEDVVSYVLQEEKPDVVVIATGSYPIRTGFQPYTFNEVSGWNQKNVFTDFDAFDSSLDLGKKVIIGDTLSFIEAPGIAEYLAKKGKEVHIVTPLDNIGLELNLLNHWDHLLPRVFAADVQIHPFTWIKNIGDRAVTLYNFYYHEKETLMEDVDSVIFTTGKLQNDSLYSAFKGKVPELYLIGDAKIGGARIGNAIYDGQKIGREI
jgi:2,4-dienoyl-CoA reductase-like NADH-dependent reductase (Old Yellow Enzyme family)/thioredoxin reductase